MRRASPPSAAGRSGRRRAPTRSGPRAGSISININATAVTGPPVRHLASHRATTRRGSRAAWCPAPPSVVVTDGQFPVPGAHVVFTVAAGRRQCRRAPTRRRRADGIAAVGGWRLGARRHQHPDRVGAERGDHAGHLHRHGRTAGHLRRDARSTVTTRPGSPATSPARSPRSRCSTSSASPPRACRSRSACRAAPSTPGTTTTGAQRPGAAPVVALSAAAGPQSITADGRRGGAGGLHGDGERGADLELPDQRQLPGRDRACTQPSAAVKQVFTDAVTRWQTIIVGGLPPIVLTGSNVIGPFSINTGIPGVGTVPCIPQVSQHDDQGREHLRLYPADRRRVRAPTSSGSPHRSTCATAACCPTPACMIFDEANIDAAAGQRRARAT